ncbi:MAG: hypothetical protein M3N21_05150 [Actinomycetota bacterium]|nr:hypothetical protein [Actinomycetota bacterium]
MATFIEIDGRRLELSGPGAADEADVLRKAIRSRSEAVVSLTARTPDLQTVTVTVAPSNVTTFATWETS